MSIIYDMPVVEYHAIAALSAGYCIRSEQECPAQAWWDSAFNPKRPEQEPNHNLDIGTAAHLAVLEQSRFLERIEVIPHASYRTNDAKDRRDRAVAQGKVALLPDQLSLIERLAKAIYASDASHWFNEEVGKSEVTLQWELPGGVPCKARVDRLCGDVLVDLKTASSASPEAFQRAMVRDGHHIRAAWYKDGALACGLGRVSYKFVVVGKAPPHLVSMFEIDDRAEEWGRMCYRRAVTEYAEGKARGQFRGYTDGVRRIGLPNWAEYRLADEEADGMFSNG